MIRAGLAMTALALGLGACRSTGVRRPEGPLPSYGQLRDEYNLRTQKLPRLWTKAAVRVVTRDDQGHRKTEQGDAYLQVILPDRVSLSVGKSIADFYFYLGSNSEWFW
ncbi:MAG: hypothetical protein H6811_00025, partial [Phycisphaeraceae bacterium]|nr:hypothetical protein [Phycisphaeraceae bacterium]